MIDRPVNVMVIGGGGREHAICWKLTQSPLLNELICLPGNGGTASLPKTTNMETISVNSPDGSTREVNVRDLNAKDFPTVAQFARDRQIDLVVIGPDNPLADGIVDVLEDAGLRVFGPRQASARLESSKAHAKEFMVIHGIPTARHVTLDSHEDAVDFIRGNEWARVVKVDGLALGKGVFVCDNETETRDALQIIFRENRFGESGKKVVLEERLMGEEVSLLMFCDGKTLVPMPASQDHKRRFDGDKGPNTGGMGVFAPVDLYARCRDSIERDVIAPLRKALENGSLKYKGVLYVGILVVNEGLHGDPMSPGGLKPYVLEFNARFGDPETQVILPLLESDLLQVLWSCTDGTLAEQSINWSNSAACCVIACADAYPEGSSRGEEIRLGDSKNGTIIFHSGTKLDGNRLLSAGGRVLGVTALGRSLNEAIEHAYEGIKSVSFKDMAYRKDIGRRTLSGCP